MSLRKKRKKIIQEGFGLLMENEKTDYDQVTILKKLRYLNIDLSTGFLSNLYKTGKASDRYLKKVSEGFCQIIRSELCLEYSENQECFVKVDGECEGRRVPEFGEEEKKALSAYSPLTYHKKGRLFIAEKTAFISTAKKEVYEVGVRLKRFSEYFTTRSEDEFKVHVEELLKAGVNFKSYLLDPNSNTTHLYFSDRAKLLEKEKNSISIIKEVIADLISIGEEMKEKNYPGKFEVYTYSNIPTNAFMVIDPETKNGKMIVQHYIYGVKRNLCPTVEFTKEGSPKLFARYLASLQGILKNAKKVVG